MKLWRFIQVVGVYVVALAYVACFAIADRRYWKRFFRRTPR